MKVPFVGASYQTDARSFSTERSVNLYPIITESQNSKTQYALRGTPGLSLFCTAGSGSVRGSISSTSNRAFVVSSDEFIEINRDGTTTTRGTLSSQTGQVSIAENPNEIIVVDGTNGWTFTLSTNTWTKITSVNFPSTPVVSFQDGYFLAIETGTGKFYVSNLNNGQIWDALDFTTVESSPDSLVSLISDNGNVWLFGNRSVEVYQNTGDVDFPFERISGAIIQTGCAAAQTVRKFDNTIAWLGIDEQGKGVIWKSEGYEARRISTQAIEAIIDDSEDYTDSYAWVYHEQGHVFYCLQIRGLNTTLVYDGSTGQWHERVYTNPITGQEEQHRGSTHFFFNQKNLVGDRETGAIYDMDLRHYSDNGEELIRTRIAPHYQDEKRLVTYGSFELDMEVGVGTDTGQGKNPQIMMQYSNDGGNTWSSELFKSLGAIGQYKTRVRWLRLGRARDRVFKVSVSDPVFVQFNEAYINAS